MDKVSYSSSYSRQFIIIPMILITYVSPRYDHLVAENQTRVKQSLEEKLQARKQRRARKNIEEKEKAVLIE